MKKEFIINGKTFTREVITVKINPAIIEPVTAQIMDSERSINEHAIFWGDEGSLTTVHFYEMVTRKNARGMSKTEKVYVRPGAHPGLTITDLITAIAA